jgi:high-affinity Fe2+/Pb2+ permease
MEFAIGIMTHTPIWAWILLAYLIWQGIKAMQPRTGTIWRALIVPAIFIVWGLSRLGLSQQAGMASLFAWIAAALVLLPVGVLTPRPFEVDHTTGQIKRAGSIFPLIRNIIVFAAQYSVAVIAAIHTDDRAMAAIIGRAISGATAGYFIGSAIALLRRYWKQRKAGL